MGLPYGSPLFYAWVLRFSTDILTYTHFHPPVFTHSLSDLPAQKSTHSMTSAWENIRDDFTDLRENYVIFIIEHDVFGENKPIYHVERVITESNVHFDDGEHITSEFQVRFTGTPNFCP